MTHPVLTAAQTRYSTKSYKDKRISDSDLSTLKELIRLAPSSVNGQPWHIILAGTQEGKARVAKSAERYPFNINTIMNASHVFVFASRLTFDEQYLLELLEKEDADGRFTAGNEFKERMHEGRSMFVDIFRDEYQDEENWSTRQVYLNIGNFLLGAACMGLDATPMEGVDPAILDEEFNLQEKGYRALAAVAVGYHNDDDFNKALPKSRLNADKIFTII